jgi:hypothetical protein
MNWDTLLRYTFRQRIVYSQDAALKVWARRELTEGMQWLADELRLEAIELMRAQDEGMSSAQEDG